MPLTCDASCNVESSAAKLKKFYVKKAHWITRHTFFFKTTEGIYMPYSAKHIFPSSESASALKKKKKTETETFTRHLGMRLRSGELTEQHWYRGKNKKTVQSKM